MYNRIFQLKELGFSKSKIAKKLGIARGTVIDYLERDPEEMAIWLASTKRRTRKVDKHQDEILSWVKEHPELTSAQIADWLDERYPAYEVGESTVRREAREMQKEVDLPVTTHTSAYDAVPRLPIGLQAPVGFGQTGQKNEQGQSVKLCGLGFVLSRSRQQYMEWLDRPFTTK